MAVVWLITCDGKSSEAVGRLLRQGIPGLKVVDVNDTDQFRRLAARGAPDIIVSSSTSRTYTGGGWTPIIFREPKRYARTNQVRYVSMIRSDKGIKRKVASHLRRCERQAH